MKNKIAAFLCLLIVMGMLPTAVVSLSKSGKAAAEASATVDSAEETAASTKKNDASKNIISSAADICAEDFCDEALKAAVIIANTNYKAAGEVSDTDYNSDSELFKRLENIYNSKKELYITYDDQIRYIPRSYCSNGVTKNSEKYDYIRSVASPWDCESEEYSEENICEGVSMYGVNYLCENGYSAEEALKWYLPESNVKKC